jgi:hypothetical protein
MLTKAAVRVNRESLREPVDSARTMVDRVEQRVQLKLRRLVGDTAYRTAPKLAWIVEQRNIEPHVPVWDKTERKDDTFSSVNARRLRCSLHISSAY